MRNAVVMRSAHLSHVALALLFASAHAANMHKASWDKKCRITIAMLDELVRSNIRADTAADLALLFSMTCKSQPGSELTANITHQVDTLVNRSISLATVSERTVAEWRSRRAIGTEESMLGEFTILPGCRESIKLGKGSVEMRTQGKRLCDSPTALLSNSSCRVVSIGSNGEIEFEEKVHSIAPDCAVEIWDGTLKGSRANLRDKIPAWSHFVPHNFEPDSWKHSSTANVAIFKIDCEGCEVTSLQPWLEHVCSDHVMMEVHVLRNYVQVSQLMKYMSRDYEVVYGEDNPLCGAWSGMRCLELDWRRFTRCSRNNSEPAPPLPKMQNGPREPPATIYQGSPHGGDARSWAQLSLVTKLRQLDQALNEGLLRPQEYDATRNRLLAHFTN